jgi:hypothetical protein
MVWRPDHRPLRLIDENFRGQGGAIVADATTAPKRRVEKKRDGTLTRTGRKPRSRANTSLLRGSTDCVRGEP